MLTQAIVCYLFLGGAGAATCLLASIGGLLVPKNSITTPSFLTLPRAYLPTQAGFRGAQTGLKTCGRVIVSREYKLLFAPSFASGIFALLLGVILLLIDLGNADRAVLLFTSAQPTYITFGAFCLAICMVLSCVLVCVWAGILHIPYPFFTVLEVFCALFSLATMTYTGLLLQSIQAIGLWNTPCLVVLFVLSAASCGCACVLIASQFSGAAQFFAHVLQRVVSIDSILLVLELICAGILLFSLYLGCEGEASSLSGTAQSIKLSLALLLTGEYAPLFWLGFVFFGICVPACVEFFVLRRVRSFPLGTVFTCACVLVGAFCMRFSFAMAGMHPILAAAGA